MTHVNRWRTITATATTAVLAAGAFGISAAVEGRSEDRAEPIEMTSETTVGDPVEDGVTTLDRSVQSTVSAQSEASEASATAEVSPLSEESVEEELRPAATQQGAAAAEVQPEESPSPSPEDSPSPSPEGDSASISLAEDSPSIEDSPSAEDSPSIDDDEESFDSAS